MRDPQVIISLVCPAISADNHRAAVYVIDIRRPVTSLRHLMTCLRHRYTSSHDVITSSGDMYVIDICGPMTSLRHVITTVSLLIIMLRLHWHMFIAHFLLSGKFACV